MLTKTLRSRFSHEVGEKVEGFTILEKRVIIPPDPVERRLGVYDYLVEVPPEAEKPKSVRKPARQVPVSEPPSVTRATPEEMGATMIRRFSPR
ncbi:MAG TPA: hypothetical protein VG672_21190 [Bryobacteraceae bacterium]|jgi:hypothetical protein|nr:hypothetical protein [Bryobacteraceae bacterium]